MIGVVNFMQIPDVEHREVGFDIDRSYIPRDHSGAFIEKKDFSLPCMSSPFEEDDEITESKIKAFLDEKAFELKKLQTPLYEEYFNSLNTSCSCNVIIDRLNDETVPKFLKSPPKGRPPNQIPVSTPSKAVDNSEVLEVMAPHQMLAMPMMVHRSFQHLLLMNGKDC
ncbi:Mitogen-activated protein kinase kinase kinase ANP1 [Spatholobus suberectus]|nr:Mitogen-activated protein kinase kinase kinase ANP1 [Spatholobus suberectus]